MVLFNAFQNKVQFQAFTVESASPCPKCGSTKVLIAPTQNTHAASARCQSCGKFYRWLGRKELESLGLQHALKRLPRQVIADGNAHQRPDNTKPVSLDSEHTNLAQG